MIKLITINIVTAICLALLIAEIAFVIVSAARKERAERILFWRGFKKGKCVVIYITAIPLYFIGYLYSGQGIFKAFFSSVNRIINLVVLKYDTDAIESLMNDNLFYTITIYTCFVLVGINALIFVFSLTAQHLWEMWQSLTTRFTRKDRVFVFGKNEKSLTLFRSNQGKRNVTIVDKMSFDDSLSLYFEKIPYIATPYPEKTIQKIVKYIKKDSGRYKKAREKLEMKYLAERDEKKRKKLLSRIHPRQTVVILNTRDDEMNMKLCRMFNDAVFGSGKKQIGVDPYGRFNLYVYGDPRYEAIYDDIIGNSDGCFHYENEYQSVALDFVDRFPLTRFMTEEQIDYNTALIKPEVKLNVILVGFGKANQQIFLSSEANNVLATSDEKGEIRIKPVYYTVFDKQSDAKDNKNLNHSYYRFDHELRDEIAIELANKELEKQAENESDPKKKEQILSQIKATGYLPLPEKSAVLVPKSVNINDGEFYDEIKRLVTEKGAFSYIVIAFGSDLENIDMAQKLVEKRNEWESENLVIFVKARGWTKEQSFLEENGCYFIGSEKQISFNMESVISDTWFELSKLRNALYYVDNQSDGSTPVTRFDLERAKKSVQEKWYEKRHEHLRASNQFACLNLRTKLHLMGLDYCFADETELEPISDEEFFKIYAPELCDKLDTTESGRPIIDRRTLEFPNGKRGNLAIQEHLRWNAFMMMKGLIPSSIDQILNEKVDGKNTNGKRYELRRHGNITTMRGLVKYRQLIAERDGKSELDTDVIKYDYEILDEAQWMLEGCGCVIVKKDALEKERAEKSAKAQNEDNGKRKKAKKQQK